MAKITISNNPAMAGLIYLKPNIVFAAPGGEELALQLLKPHGLPPTGKDFRWLSSFREAHGPSPINSGRFLS